MRNVVGGLDITRGRSIDRKIGDLLTSGGSKLVTQTSLIRGDLSQDLNTAGKTIGSGAGWPTELEVKPRFISVRLRGGPEVWLAR